MELHVFAWTLEGVDHMRKLAKVMGRDIRMIKVKEYRPTRSDLLGGGGGHLYDEQCGWWAVPMTLADRKSVIGTSV